ncbi:MAG TPA: alpha-1,4-glucan--maltose-1-phosphate maltosyltransferase, partial [Pseudomonas sp.]|nr:alpha-1,4-glucan--maltose-1-phosphate maltosyltransferase [Pseudomonas sp.]
MSDAQPNATIHPRLEQALQMPRIAIESTLPVVDDGRFAAKAIIGQPVMVTSRIFADGHDQLAAAVCWREKGESNWRRARLKLLGNDNWQGQFTPTQVAEHEFVIEAWWDVFESYRYELSKKHTAGVPVQLELEEGRLLLEKAVARAQGENRAILDDLLHRLGSAHLEDERVSLLLAAETAAAMAAADPREHCSRSPVYPLDVERPLAQFASWY